MCCGAGVSPAVLRRTVLRKIAGETPAPRKAIQWHSARCGWIAQARHNSTALKNTRVTFDVNSIPGKSDIFSFRDMISIRTETLLAVLFTKHFRECAREAGLQERISRIRKLGRHHFLADEKQRTRHFSERQPKRERGRRKQGRAVQCLCQDAREFAISNWIWGNGIDRSGEP